MGNKKIIDRICLVGMFIALYICLCFFRIRIGKDIEISFGTVVIAFAAIAFSPVEAISIAFLGETVNQLFLTPYGISPTTPLWIMPPVIRCAIIVLVAYIFKKKNDDIINHPFLLYFTIAGTALVISAFDTLILFLDGLIMGYPVTFTWITSLFRILSSQINALATSLIIFPLRKALDYYVKKRYGN